MPIQIKSDGSKYSALRCSEKSVLRAKRVASQQGYTTMVSFLEDLFKIMEKNPRKFKGLLTKEIK